MELVCVPQPSLFAAGPAMEAKLLNGAEVSLWVVRTFERMQQVMGREYHALDPVLQCFERKEKGWSNHSPAPALGTPQQTTAQSEKTQGGDRLVTE